MLLTLLYHRVDNSLYGNPYPLLEKHLRHLSENYQTVAPNDPLIFSKLQLCLTFDDAYFDFYHLVFPLLQKYNIKATLSVPTGFILETTELSPKERLDAIPYAMEDDTYQEKAPFCTWKELLIMHQSGLVHIASHSYTHTNLLGEDVDLNHELLDSKTLLEKKLQCPIDTFVYPFGRWNPTIHSLVKTHYKIIMRIGSAINFSWANSDQLHYRIPCDQLQVFNAPFFKSNYLLYTFRYIFNRIRGK